MNNETRVSDPASQYDKVEIRNIALAVAFENNKDKNKNKTEVLGNVKRPVMGDVISTQLIEGMKILTNEAKERVALNKHSRAEEISKD